MSKHLVLIGGGHAHMMTLAGLKDIVAAGHRVTVIQPSEHHYYSGMGPGMLGGTYRPEDIRFATRKVVEAQGGRFLLDRALRIEPEERRVHLESGGATDYDVLSCNAGSQVPMDLFAGAGEEVIPVKPIEGLARARAMILDRLRGGALTIAVVGGGPSAVEVAGNLRQLADDAGLSGLEVQLFTGSGLMARLPQRIRSLAYRLLRQKNITLVEGHYVQSVRPGELQLEDGSTHRADLIFAALGVQPSSLFSASGLPTGPDGGLEVNDYLQSTAYANIFGGGDCICFASRPLDKVGVYAVRQNPVLLHNLKASLDNGPLKPFDPGGEYLLIYNLGGGQGILAKWWLVFSGSLAFRIKDVIDRRFMRTFQALEKNGT